ncbi:hypothetical protein BM525_20345 (plasmid) [Alteromonas mediterranea]|uniref:Uncharacterized protein n=1 Tax=Alteromonas mediterranea TaxID=314275 RepID=A0AAC9JED8_9ALTE|nr:hypothetical protein [Alteromonas mediterranea]APD92230.1 hypothetical protein BM524_20150 [Alteromonas mediterranea]APE00085.1 hypothetical protein BM525_20345 [Alteromonas mediterranea]|tara:strand:- start:5768 stop:5947 length:180 start_codon:yes stop_codon:yes gene_type:complete
MNPQHSSDGQLNDRNKWQPFTVVCINSNSNGLRAKKLAAACGDLDRKLAEIFKIKFKSS